MVKTIPPDIINFAAYELEQAIIKSSAEDGSDLDDPDLGIFESQRERYREWMATVIPIVLEAMKRDEGCQSVTP